MLDLIDLDQSVTKEEYDRRLDATMYELQRLHRQVYERKIPVVLVFDGWEGSGKGDAINKLLTRMDPRGAHVHAFETPAEEEIFRPYFWRFWRRLPRRGEVSVLEQAWHHWVVKERVERRMKDAQWRAAIESVRNFERLLADDGTILLKFWLHIGKKEQKKRFKEWEQDPAFSFKVGEDAWRENKQYKRRLAASESMISSTDDPHAPWILLPSTDRRYSRLRVVETVCETLARGVEQARSPAKPRAITGRITRGRSPLRKLNFDRRLGRKAYHKQKDKLSDELRELQHLCYTTRLPVVIVFEGSDAAGKGGAIRRLTSPLDPRGYTVHPVGAPEGEERVKHYLWRFWRDVPKAGHWAIFDRSWYGRVLVERVEGLASVEAWRRAYSEIREFERQLAHAGTVVLKFWLQISKKEQLRRFREREKVVYKQHKLTDEDWRNREKWSLYEAAVSDMILETSTSQAPWTLVAAEDKPWARIRVMRTVARAVKKGLRRSPDWGNGLHL